MITKFLAVWLMKNGNLYGGGRLAMPIRLLITEDQAEEAARIERQSMRNADTAAVT